MRPSALRGRARSRRVASVAARTRRARQEPAAWSAVTRPGISGVMLDSGSYLMAARFLACSRSRRSACRTTARCVVFACRYSIVVSWHCRRPFRRVRCAGASAHAREYPPAAPRLVSRAGGGSIHLGVRSHVDKSEKRCPRRRKNPSFNSHCGRSAGWPSTDRFDSRQVFAAPSKHDGAPRSGCGRALSIDEC